MSISNVNTFTRQIRQSRFLSQFDFEALPNIKPFSDENGIFPGQIHDPAKIIRFFSTAACPLLWYRFHFPAGWFSLNLASFFISFFTAVKPYEQKIFLSSFKTATFFRWMLCYDIDSDHTDCLRFSGSDICFKTPASSIQDSPALLLCINRRFQGCFVSSFKNSSERRPVFPYCGKAGPFSCPLSYGRLAFSPE